MNNFYIVTNELKDKDFEATNLVKAFIEENGKNVIGVFDSKPVESDEHFAKAKQQIKDKADCIIVFGGDGTMLRASRKFFDLDIPILGINLGNLGFLTAGNMDNVKELLMKVFVNDFFVEERMLIAAKVSHKGTESGRLYALNDVTLNRNNFLRLVKFNLYVNDEMIYNYVADGIVVSTPTGSTAYNLSLGGPLASPNAKLILVTPIAPHSLVSRSLILSADDKLEFEIVGDDRGALRYSVYFDGDESIPIEVGDRLIIAAEQKPVKFIRFDKGSFIETLKAKIL